MLTGSGALTSPQTPQFLQSKNKLDELVRDLLLLPLIFGQGKLKNMSEPIFHQGPNTLRINKLLNLKCMLVCNNKQYCISSSLNKNSLRKMPCYPPQGCSKEIFDKMNVRITESLPIPSRTERLGLITSLVLTRNISPMYRWFVGTYTQHNSSSPE